MTSDGKPSAGIAVVVDRRRPEDDEAIARHYRSVFGDSLADANRLRWRWQYGENPATTGGSPEIWVAREGQTVLGQYASMPVALWWDDREVRASWGMDVFVTPEARGKGVGARLFTTWADHVDVALGLGLTPSSYGLFRRLGYADIGPVPFFRAWLNPVAAATRRLGWPLGRVVGSAAGLGLRLVTHRPRATAIAVQTITAFGDEYDELWMRTRASYAMCVRRDAAYLNWKYVRCPHRDYHLWEARRDNRLVGFAVGREEDYRGLRLGWIVDAYTEAADADGRRALLATVLDSFRAGGVARVQVFAMSRPLVDDLRWMGFIGGRSPMQFCVRARQGMPAACLDRGRWHVVFGDSDMDR